LPDTVTASEDYALRFSGDAGAYLLSVQAQSIAAMVDVYPAIGAGAKILDHAGTHGQLAELLEQRGYLRTVSASKIDLVDRSQAHSPKIVGKLDAMPVADKSFDAVVTVRLLAHVDDLDSAVREMCRLAQKTVIVDYPSMRSINFFSRWLFKYKKRIERDTRQFVSVSDRHLDRIFAEHGFKLVARQQQFAIPMALHRALGDSKVLRFVERTARAIGITRLIGNPVVARFDRLTIE